MGAPDPRTSRSIRLLIAFALALKVREASSQEAPRFQARLTTAVDISATGPAGSIMDAVFRIRAVITSPDVRVVIRLQDGLELVAGQTEWAGGLSAGREVELRASIRATRKGWFGLAVAAEDTTATDSGGVATSSLATAYIVAGTRGGFWSTTIDGRFEPPGRRALRRAVQNAQRGPMAVDTAAGLQEGLRALPNPRRMPRLGRALRLIDSMGVDALLEDSATQAAALGLAVSQDLRDAPARGAALFEAPPLLASATCQPWTVQRTGQLTFLNQNTGQTEPLPNILIEARDAHPLVGGSLVNTFRTADDGSFNACVPYDGNGYTYITVWQDVGPVRVLRDGDPEPNAAAFPNRWGNAWDLAQSPTLPLTTTHPEIAFALLTWHKGVSEATRLFGITREQLTSWYYNNADTDYWCPLGFQPNPFEGCTHFGENIYTHRFNSAGGDNIWVPHGQFTRIHEYGHGFEYRLLGDRFHNGGCGESHSLSQPSSVVCASNEGWADFFAAVSLPIVQLANGSSAAFESAVFGTEAWHTTGSRGPEIEASVAAYLFDLVDGPGVPWFRPVTNDDDNIQAPFSYLVQVIRDGRAEPPYDNQSPSAMVAIVDDVTPVPFKSEFFGYDQPTAIQARVPRPPSVSLAAHRYIWRWIYFGLTDAQPLVVTASVPQLVTRKAVYSIYGSASGGAGGGYSGWRWDRADCAGCAFVFWSTNQNSQFVAYGGQYTLGWRLEARDAVGTLDADTTSTQVCIPQSPSCGYLVRADVTALGAAQVPAGPAPPDTVTSAGLHFGSGLWVSREGDQHALQLYSLYGQHDEWSPSEPWPNVLDRRQGATTRALRTTARALTLTERVVATSPTTAVVQVRLQGLQPSERYRLSFAADPDLGRSPVDDRLAWLDSLGAVVALDTDGSAVAYGWGGPALSGVTVREYGAQRRDPLTGEEAYTEQRRASGISGIEGDIRFALTSPPLAASRDGEFAATFVVARGANTAAALLALRVGRASVAAVQGVAAGALAQTTQRTLQARQHLAAGSAVFGLTRQGDVALASFSVQGQAPTIADVARVRSEGITAIVFAVSAPEANVPVRVSLLDARGRVVRHGPVQSLESGTYVYRWDGAGDAGQRMPPGVYQAVVEAAGIRRRVTLVLTN